VVFVREAVAIARRAEDRPRIARWLGELALTSCYRGDLREALAAANEAYQTAVDVGDVNWEALAIDALALVHLARGEPEKAIQAAERTLSMYEGAWQHTVIYVLNVLGLAYLDLQKIDQAIEYLDRAHVEARVCEDVRVEGIAEFNLAHAYRLKGDVQKALEYGEAAVQKFTRTQGGELPAAVSLASALRARAAGIDVAESRALVAVARACLSNPDLRNPHQILADAAALASAAHQPDVAAEAEQLLAQVRERVGRPQAEV
jgi:tetratricopeptide (TPR) repeat protein